MIFTCKKKPNHKKLDRKAGRILRASVKFVSAQDSFRD